MFISIGTKTILAIHFNVIKICSHKIKGKLYIINIADPTGPMAILTQMSFYWSDLSSSIKCLTWFYAYILHLSGTNEEKKKKQKKTIWHNRLPLPMLAILVILFG